MLQLNRPVVLSIAGYDPCGGAGLLADIKTFEQHKVYGLGIVSALTLQTEKEFFSLDWTNEREMLKQLKTFLSYYPIKVVKFGLAQSWKMTNKMVKLIKAHNDKIKIIIDPVLKTSTGYAIFTYQDNRMFTTVLRQIDLLTPNSNEAVMLSGERNYRKAGKYLSQYCNVLLKGGHNRTERGTDLFFSANSLFTIKPGISKVYPKHGSGCVLSAAIASNLAFGKGLRESCILAKNYTEGFLKSNKSLIGYHVQ